MKNILILVTTLAASTSFATEPVTVDTFVRAETDHMIRANMAAFGVDIGALTHVRAPTTPENQPVIRMNQDTLYTGVVLDLSEPVQITLPDIDGRYMSMQVVNQDHYMIVESRPGTYELTEEQVGTRFAMVTIRTFVEVNDPADIASAHAAQDAIQLSGGGDGPFVAPDWDLEDLAIARQALSDIAVLGFDSSYAYGSKDEVRPVDYLIGAAAGWGGLPKRAATYLIDAVDNNDDATPHVLRVKDVPVDAFWSITIYNADGYLEANELGINNYNNFSAVPNDDGSHTIHLGGCDDGRINCIPITPGWNYTVRLYEPRQEILDGSWTFPEPQPID